jgi:ubiquinone/menaquinone biosynthesis C-methylase UbiE
VDGVDKEPITNEELVTTLRKMAVESGLGEIELDEYLQKYALEYGSLTLLRNLVGVDFDLEVATNSFEYMRTRRPVLNALTKPFVKGEKVLSIGCGSGVAELNIAQNGCEVCGLDTHENAVRIANRLAEEVALSDECKFMEVSGYEYPFEDGSFDAVLYSHSLHEIEDIEASLRESYRVLKPEGRVIVLEDGNTRDDVMEPIMNGEFHIKEEKSLPLGGFQCHGSVTSVIAITLEKKTRP